MKITTFLFGVLLLVLLPGAAQGQCQIQTWSYYAVSASEALNNTQPWTSPGATGTDILTSVVVDGSSSMWMQTAGCPDSIVSQFNNNKQYITHFPSVLNQIGSVGGWTSGPSFCAECYGSFQTNLDSGPVNPGQILSFQEGGEVDCSVAGTIFNVFQYLDLEVAYTRSLNTGVSRGTTPCPNGQEQCTIWSTVPYCDDNPDWKPDIYIAPSRLSATSVWFIDAITGCVRIKGTGINGWVCAQSAAAFGWPQWLALSPAHCTSTP